MFLRSKLLADNMDEIFFECIVKVSIPPYSEISIKSFGVKTKVIKNDIKIYGSLSKEVKCHKTVKVFSDHRIALSASILGIISNNPIKLDDKGKSMATSYPNFKKDLKEILID